LKRTTLWCFGVLAPIPDSSTEPSDATGVSPTGPARGALAGAAPGAAAALAGVAGRHGTADADHRGGRGGATGSLPGDRRLPAHRGAAAVGARYGRGPGLAAERSRGPGAGRFAGHERTNDGVGRRLAAGGTGATLRLRAGGVGAPFWSQPQLGVAPVGLSGTAAGKRAAASAQRSAHRPSGDEVSGAGGAFPSRRMPASGRSVRHAPLHHPGSRSVVCRLAQGHSGGAATPCATTPVVPQNATAEHPATGHRRRTAARPGDGYCGPAPGQPVLDRAHRRTGWPAARRVAGPARTSPTTTQPAGRQGPALTGAGERTC